MSRHAAPRPAPLVVRIRARARYRREGSSRPWYATRTGSGLDWAATMLIGSLLAVGLALPH